MMLKEKADGTKAQLVEIVVMLLSCKQEATTPVQQNVFSYYLGVTKYATSQCKRSVPLCFIKT